MIKILFLAANPSNTTRLAIDREVREIQQRLYATLHGQHFQIEQEWAVSVGDLQAVLLRHRPQLVHFSGHGDPSGKLQVLGTDSRAVSIPIHALGDLFHLVGDTVRCVVLNACFSAPQADAIRRHTDCVVGMTDALADEAAIAFAWAFYQALGFGKSIRTAFELGRNQLDLSAMADVDVPALLVRPGVDPDGVRLLMTESGNLGAPSRALPVSGEDSPGGGYNRISTNVTNIVGGSHGAIAIGQDATAVGTISHYYGSAQTLTQEQHKAAIREAEKALLNDEDRLASPVFEALRQFLRVAREIQVERRSVDDIRVEMTARFMELWTAIGFPTRGFLSGLEVLGALSKHPAAGEVVKKLLGG